MRKLLPIAVSAGLGFAAAMLLQGLRTAEPKGATVEEMKRVQEQLDALRTRVARAERTPQRAASAQASALPADQPTTAAEPHDDEHRQFEREPEPVLNTAQYQQLLMTAIDEADVIDLSWQREVEHHFQSGIPALLPASSRLRSVRCQGWLCRIEVSHAAAKDYESFTMEFLDRLSGKAGTDQTYTGVASKSDRELVAVSFVAKRGFALPTPADAPSP